MGLESLVYWRSGSGGSEGGMFRSYRGIPDPSEKGPNVAGCTRGNVKETCRRVSTVRPFQLSDSKGIPRSEKGGDPEKTRGDGPHEGSGPNVGPSQGYRWGSTYYRGVEDT